MTIIDDKNKGIVSERILLVLKICFWFDIAAFIGIQIWSYKVMSDMMHAELYQPDLLLIIFGTIPELSIFFLFGYSVYFFYKYDKYSKSGLYFLFFHFLYAHIYFYRVIWKRKRELINSCKSELVLGNKIFIETEEE